MSASNRSSVSKTELGLAASVDVSYKHSIDRNATTKSLHLERNRHTSSPKSPSAVSVANSRFTAARAYPSISFDAELMIFCGPSVSRAIRRWFETTPIAPSAENRSLGRRPSMQDSMLLCEPCPLQCECMHFRSWMKEVAGTRKGKWKDSRGGSGSSGKPR